jgi:D-alanyl-lipoteichoic acid acyltransferase DltB (MBOAT superfamily)
MSFISLEFIALIIISALLYYVVPKKFRFLVIIVANVFFYVYSCQIHSLYLLISILSVYFGARLIENSNDQKKNLKNIDLDKDLKKKMKAKFNKQKKLALIATILLNLGILLVLKYDNFFINLFNDITKNNLSFYTFIIPMGISYYTLEALSYIIDVYNDKYEATKNFFKLFLFLTFYPLMVEGPICRYNEVADELYEGHDFNYQKICNNALRITWGFTKKLVIADRAAVYVNAIFGGSYTGLCVLLGMCLYVLEIYAEFSGCMDIVIGIGGLFGIKIPENFNTPFFSKNINEFWRRWHITLGTWLKDYIFYPVSLSKLNLKISMKVHKWHNKHLADFIAMILPLFCVWFTMGFWHGSTSKYIIYGMYYYLIMLLSYLLAPVFKKIIAIFKINTKCFSYHLFQMIRTFIIVLIGMTLFRADTVEQAINIVKSVFGNNVYSVFAIFNGHASFTIICLTTIFMFFISILKHLGINPLEKLNEQNLVFKYIVYLAAILFVLVFGSYGFGYNPSSFIYGGF